MKKKKELFLCFPFIWTYLFFSNILFLTCWLKLKLNKLQHLLPKPNEWTSCPNIVLAVYIVKLHIFNINKPETFYFAHEDEFNKFINAYKEHRKVSEILEI